MSAWWASLTLLQRILACIAAPATLVLVIQTLLSVAGLAGEHDLDGSEHDVGHDGAHGFEHDQSGGGEHDSGHDNGASGLRLLTLRGIVAFLAVYGWGALAISRAGHPWLAAVGFGLLMGFAAMLLVAAVMKLFLAMQSNGAIELENAVGLGGTVYLTIPGAGGGKGKVNVLLQERYAEFDAVTEEAAPIATGSEIVVTGVTEDGMLIVAKKTV